MRTMLVIPAIDLRQGKCVRLTQGRKEQATVYDGDPVRVAEGFEKDGARMLHVVDLDGAFSESNGRNREVLRELVRAVSIPVQFGGGLRSANDIEQAISLGVARVVIGTLAVESPDMLATIVGQFGAAQVAVGIDARNGQVVTRGWETEEQITAFESGAPGGRRRSRANHLHRRRAGRHPYRTECRSDMPDRESVGPESHGLWRSRLSRRSEAL